MQQATTTNPLICSVIGADVIRAGSSNLIYSDRELDKKYESDDICGRFRYQAEAAD